MLDSHLFSMVLIGAIFLAVVGAVAVAVIAESTGGFHRRHRPRRRARAPCVQDRSARRKAMSWLSRGRFYPEIR